MKDERNLKNLMLSISWTCKTTWKTSSYNTLWCLIGCSIGDFGTIFYFQMIDHSLSIYFVMLIAIFNGLLTSIVSKLRQIPDYEEEEELEEVDNDTFRQMYQGGLSKSEMEKSATRKFTARSPRVETRAKPIEDTVSDVETSSMSSTDTNETPDLNETQDALDTSEIEASITESNETVYEETTDQTTVDPIEENPSSEEENFTASDQLEDTNENEATNVEELSEVTSDIEEDNTPKE